MKHLRCTNNYNIILGKIVKRHFNKEEKCSSKYKYDAVYFKENDIL